MSYWPSSLHAVGTWKYDRSPFAVMDMAGNVSEWTANDQNGEAIRMGGHYRLRRKLRILRRFCWAETTLTEPPGTQVDWLGFRCVVSE